MNSELRFSPNTHNNQLLWDKQASSSAMSHSISSKAKCEKEQKKKKYNTGICIISGDDEGQVAHDSYVELHQESRWCHLAIPEIRSLRFCLPTFFLGGDYLFLFSFAFSLPLGHREVTNMA